MARFHSQSTYLLFICGDESRVVVLPAGEFLRMVSGAVPISTQWKILAREQNQRWFFRVAKKGQFEVTDFLNRYDFAPHELRRAMAPTLGELIPVGRRPREAVPVEEYRQIPKDLAESLVDSSTDSDHPSRFEETVARVFSELGLEASRLGRPGQTDVLITSPFRAIVDCKATASGSLAQIYFTRIKRHQREHEAQSAAVVSVQFAPAVIEDARAEGVSLWESGRLVELLNLNREVPIPPSLLKVLFETQGLVTEDAFAQVRSFITETTSKVDRAIQILEVLDFVGRTPEEIKGRLAGRGLGDFDLDEIVVTLNFFSFPILDLIAQTPKGYCLKITLPQARIRLRTILYRMLSEPTRAEA
ncbi:MAG: restriction endonuclease [Chloroflexi bacterium]|nr:restriction endonuclease [Chloroflexota bacterium]